MGLVTNNRSVINRNSPAISRGDNTYTLDTTAVQASHTGDTSATTVYTYVLPGGTMGANGVIMIESLWSCNNDASVKTVKIKFGGTAIKSQALTSKVAGFFPCSIFNRNSEASQIAMNAAVTAHGATTSALVTSAVDTTADVDIIFTVTLADAADTCSLEAATIKLFKEP